MSGSGVTTVAGLDALPEGTVVVGFVELEHVLARKPRATDFPHAVPGFWEVVGSETGTTSEDLITGYGTLGIMHEATA